MQLFADDEHVDGISPPVPGPSVGDLADFESLANVLYEIRERSVAVSARASA